MPSGLYFQGPDRWTSHPDDAFDFKLVSRALKFVEKKGMEHMEIAFAVDTPGIAAVPVDEISDGLSSSHLDPVLATLIAANSIRQRRRR